MDARQKEIPNLISPHLGDRVSATVTVASATVPSAAPASSAAAKPAASTQVVALPLGGRIKIDPWSDKLEMLKAKPVGAVAEREKMPFEVTPFMLYLTREVAGNSSMGPTSGAISADSKNTADKTEGPQQ